VPELGDPPPLEESPLLKLDNQEQLLTNFSILPGWKVYGEVARKWKPPVTRRTTRMRAVKFRRLINTWKRSSWKRTALLATLKSWNVPANQVLEDSTLGFRLMSWSKTMRSRVRRICSFTSAITCSECRQSAALRSQPAQGFPCHFQPPGPGRLAWPESARRREADRPTRKKKTWRSSEPIFRALVGRERRTGQRRPWTLCHNDEELGDIELLSTTRQSPRPTAAFICAARSQVQIWDWNKVYDPKNPTRRPHLGSGGLFNNTPGTTGRDPLGAGRRSSFGALNQFRIRQIATVPGSGSTTSSSWTAP